MSDRTIAVIPWGDLWDDFLDSVGLSLEAFCAGGIGGWLLGYIEALRVAGIQTVVILVSARVSQPLRTRHAATGAAISVLPPSGSYMALRRQLASPSPYVAKNVEEMIGHVRGARRTMRRVAAVLAPYTATPVSLLAGELRRHGCQAILCQDYESPRFDVCTALGQLLNIPVLACFQSGSYDINRLGRFVRPLTMRACRGLVIAPRAEIERVRDRYRMPIERISRIFNPVDVQFWRPEERSEARAALGLPVESELAVWHGRVDIRSKGLDVLLEAWDRVCADRATRDLRLVLLGGGEDSEELRRRLGELQTRSVLWLDTYIDDRQYIRRFLSAGDVYAFPSVFEGFPVAPLEAMACGVPVVAADASGIADTLEEGERSGGIVVPKGDVAAFAAALGRALDHPHWRREVGARARRRMEEAFSVEAVGTQFRALFDRALG